MKTKLERIADKSVHEPKPEFTSLYHLINKELLIQCHRELDGSKAVGIDEVTKNEYGNAEILSAGDAEDICQLILKL